MMKLLTVIPELEPFLAMMRPFFLSRNQFRHFTRYIIGLIGARRKTIRTMAASSLEGFDQSSLNRFINSSSWETDALAKASMKMLADDHGSCSNGVIFLIIDDTLLEKFGESMDSVGYLYSAKEGDSILSHDLVSMLLVCSCGQVVPTDLRQYVKESVSKEEKREFKTRIELAREMIESLNLPRHLSKNKTVVLFDSWYLCREIVDAIRKKRGWHFVAETKSNRNVSLNRAEEVNVGKAGVSLEGEHDCDGVVTIGEKRYGYRMLNGGKGTFMPSLHANGNVKIMAERELDGKDEIHYIVTDMLKISPEELISFFKRRHLTEEFYRDAKQNLGLGKYMVRGHQAINRHWWLVFIAYNALNRLKRDCASLAEMTVGQLCSWVEERCEQIKWMSIAVRTFIPSPAI
jgi:hypothetical protein